MTVLALQIQQAAQRQRWKWERLCLYSVSLRSMHFPHQPVTTEEIRLVNTCEGTGALSDVGAIVDVANNRNDQALPCVS